MVYTTKVVYSKDLYLTDDEFLKKTGQRVNIQSIIEQPSIHIFAQCADSIAEKLSYVSLRREDILEMADPLIVNGLIVKDRMRFFQGKTSKFNIYSILISIS